MSKVRICTALTVLLLTSACVRRQQNAALVKLPPPPAPASCKSVDGFPDPTCTPGEISSAVTQDNLMTTICKSGYTKTVRPPVSYTNPLKVQQIAAYGYSDTNVKDYEEDHFIPLELGGHPTDPHNLWPEPGASPNPKDTVEGELNRLVCSGKMTLSDAQTRIRTNWKTAVPPAN